MPIIAPSLLSANYLNLEADCKMLNESDADWYQRYYGWPLCSQH